MKQVTLQLALAIVFASAAFQFVSCAQQSLEEMYTHSTLLKYNTVQSRPLVQYSTSAVHNNNVIHTTIEHTYKERESEASSLLVYYNIAIVLYIYL